MRGNALGEFSKSFQTIGFGLSIVFDIDPAIAECGMKKSEVRIQKLI